MSSNKHLNAFRCELKVLTEPETHVVTIGTIQISFGVHWVEDFEASLDEIHIKTTVKNKGLQSLIADMLDQTDWLEENLLEMPEVRKVLKQFKRDKIKPAIKRGNALAKKLGMTRDEFWMDV